MRRRSGRGRGGEGEGEGRGEGRGRGERKEGYTQQCRMMLRERKYLRESLERAVVLIRWWWQRSWPS